MSSTSQFGKLLTASFLLLLVSGCTVTLVSDYDDQIDHGLSDLNTDVTAFVHKMNDSAGKPEGTFDQNQDFYRNEEAKIDTMIVRAQAHRVLGSCPSDKVIAAAVKVFPTASSTTNTISEKTKTDIQTYASQVPADDCSVELIELIKAAFEDLETFHKANGSIPRAADDKILVGGVGSLIHSAIVIEAAEKSNQSAKAAGGR